MGRRSTRENKNIYQTSRENMGLTRDEAGEIMQYVTADRIEKIESEKVYPRPEEVMAMAECYKVPGLCNYYCSHECPIGMVHVPEIQPRELSAITLEILSSLNAMNRERDKLIDITVDGKITPEEYDDFTQISEELKKIAQSVSALQLWVDQTIANGQIDPNLKR